MTIGDECVGILAIASRERLELLLERIDHLDRLALFVDSLGVPGPAGHDRGGPADLATLTELFADDRQEPLRDAVRAFRAEARDRVADLWVGEAFDQRVLVLVEVDAGDRGQCRGRLLVHVLQQKRPEERILCGSCTRR